MFRQMSILGIALSAGLSLCLAGAAEASLIVQESFENPSLGDNGFTYDMNTITSGTGWVRSGTGDVCLYSPGAAFTAYNWTSAMPLPTPAAGNQVLCLQASNGSNATTASWLEVYKDFTSVQIESGKKYTLTVAIGNRICEGMGDWSIAIGDAQGLTPLASTARGAGGLSDPADGSFKDYSCEFTADSTHAGHDLFAGLFRQDGCVTSCYFDNVRVTVTPEPGTVVLLVTGIAGLLAYAWRRRK